MSEILSALFFLLIGYSFIGTSEDVQHIKSKAPSEINSRNWEVVRYEGYQYGSWGNHGGKVWYHVKDSGHKNTYYRVMITSWNGELHFTYGEPEKLSRINLDSSN